VTQGVTPGTDRQVVLEGPAARKGRFLESLTPAPSVIHLATHVLTSTQDRSRAFLAFGLGPAAQSEFLETSDVAMLHVPGSLVVMTGCSTAAGDPLAGEGLKGLTRAWSIAGARAVVATQWPVKDSAGPFFASFYGHLRESTIAEALRRSQVEMLHSGTAMAAPAAWASYQEVRGAQ
jgi:CHAT domain-containing protein